ncbi:3-deoxy-manno-octulosonate cytidylyltransferase [Marinobacterium sediminicola]|uniref:3-deoxy-manno-octulosonate cytidylyltransferase n=1 Tax=Marinobacterium sediminicola TaxID=518898 RepID=A0ABY1RXB5_9GAMM|nr:3-deoxy-manno-octulosonate cytidylyltransferase [Marinobacterium sediminicola]ULG67839.1 3-deoxy-manno-octulosonate cytidylyltransferase [Marinobacterium sediminicola]SMR71480.1 3-deoxy-manno-octulosonate cytidylyltransferase (CMP-KDO synthetase) [Marinobacterium sediminicola]
MSFSVVIPARYASSRFPGKPLADLAGKPMVQHVYERACESEATRVIIATDDERIAEVALEFGAEVCMTSAEHPSGTDRLQEVVHKLGFYADDIVVNVQGDEPLIPPRIINQVAHNLMAMPTAGIATLSEPIETLEALLNPNVVKVVTDHQGMALYFSRAPIPWPRDAFMQSQDVMPEGFSWQRHIGMYAYRVKMLNDFVCWPPAPLEQTECLEQLRALWHGVGIHVDAADEAPPAGVDTPEDLERVATILLAR